MPTTCPINAAEAAGIGETLIFESGYQVRCPHCHTRLGDAIAARVRVRVLYTDQRSAAPALIHKCTGYLAQPRGRNWIRSSIPCGQLLEIQLLPAGER